jgi:hypothetical protein
MSNQTQDKQESKWRSRELGALWVRSGKNQKYLSGTINVETMPGVTEPVKVVVFTNKGREKNEKAPDYVVYRSEDSEQQSQSNVEQVATQAAQEVSSSASSASAEAASNEDIPEELF